MAPQSPRHIISALPARRRRPAKKSGLQFEHLEDRLAPALFNLSTVSASNLSNNGCVAVGDFNKDGNPDAVVSNYGPSVSSSLGNRIHVLTGNGSGGFSASSIQNPIGHTNVSFVAVGDLDNDGWDDVVASNANNQNGGSVSVFRNTNGVLEFFGTFNTQGNNSSSVALGDVTGDGKLDLVVSNFGLQTGSPGSETITGNTVDVYQGNGNFTFNLLTSITFTQGEGNPVFIPIAATLAKVDSGNTLDLIVISPGATSEGSTGGIVYVYKGNGAGGFDTATFGQFDSGGFFPVAMSVKDIDGDNDVDVVVTNVGDPLGSPEFVNQGIGVLKNNGNGAFSTTNFASNTHGPFAPAIADFDMDGDQDIAAINYGMYLNPSAPATFVSLYLNNGSGTFAPAGLPHTPDGKFGLGFPAGGGQYLAVGDFDNSGTPDIIAVGAYNSIKILLNTSTASVSTTTALASTANPSTFGQSVTITATVTAVSGAASGGTVTFFDNGVQIGSPVTLTNQQAAITISTLTVATHSITATYSGGTGFTGSTSSPLSQVVNYGLAQTLSITGAPANATAGSSFNVTVTARDQSGNLAGGYLGTVHFSSSDIQAGLPADYTFTPGDLGAHTFTITLRTSGPQSFAVTDTTTGSITGNASTTVNAAAASVFAVAGFPTPTPAGVAQGFTVTARDAFGNIATGYTGTVHFTSSDAQATFSPDYTFVPSDNGVHSFTATLRTAGTQSLTSTDTATASVTGTQSGITVTAAAASAFTLSGLPSNVTAGAAQNFTVTARDAFGNTVTGYSGTIHFTSSDAVATLPADYTFVSGDNGAHTFSVTLATGGSQSVAATDTVTASITGNATTTVSAAAATFAVSGPSSVTAGTAQSFTVTAKDALGNTATSYTGTVHFTSSDVLAGLPLNYTFTPSDNGVRTFTITLRTGGSQSVTATDTVTGSITGNATTTVNAAAATTFQVTGPSSTTAGAAQNFTVTARDLFGNTAIGYTGTVHFTSSDAQGTMPPDYTFVAGDSGSHTFTITLKTGGSQSVTATDTATASITGSATTTVNAAAATNFLVSAPSTATAGAAFNATVTARDAFGNTVTGYTGTVHFTSSDGQATLPGDYTYVPADNGAHTFTVTLRTAGSQTVTATDTATSAITGNAAITIGAAAATTYQLSAPSAATAGTAFNTTVTARDAFGNTVTGYTGTVHFTSTDGQGTLPPDYTFVAADNGAHTFTVTFRTAGSQTVTATDTATSSIAGSDVITIGAATATTYQMSAPSTATEGTAFNATVTARDAFGNIATGYTGTVHFVSNDAQATLPADYTFVPADNGAHTFTVTLRTVGNQSVIATDTTIGTITATAVVTVNASPPPPPAPQPFASGTSPGTIATVKMYNADNTLRFSAQPFGSTYRKGVRVAVGDVTGDGVPDVVASTNGTVWAKVRIIDGATGNVLSNNLLKGVRYQGKVSVAVGDVNGDGTADIAVGTNQGGSRVRVFNGGNFTKLTGFLAGPASGFKGNTSVALGDMNGDGKADLVVSSLYAGRSRVVGYTGTSLAPGVIPAAAFTKFALGGKYASGLFLALGDVNADDRADLVIGTAGTRPPSVIVLSGQALATSNTQATIANFTPAGSSSKNGVRVGVRDIDGDGDLDLLTSSGEMVSAFHGGSGLPVTGLPALIFSLDPDPGINGGVWVG